MEHPYIDDEHIVDRYLVGELSGDEAERFEEHLFVCQACLEAAEWGEELRRGVQDVSAESAVTGDAGGVAPAPWLSRLLTARATPATLAVACLVLGAIALFQRAELLRLHAPGVQTAHLAEPIGDFQVVSLGVVRDGGPGEIRLDGDADALLLSLELPSVDSARYSVTLLDASGLSLWAREDLKPSLYDTVMVALPASFLAPGDYKITVEARPPSHGGGEPALDFEFRILAR